MALPDPSDSSAALVTGASSGIGAAIARELAGRGHNLILVARRAERLAELAAELSAATGVRAEPVAADLAEDAERDRLAAEVERLELAVEVLVNCAGFGGAGDLHRDDRERMVAMVRLNCDALLDLQARYAPAMAARRRGAIVNLASTAAFQPMPGQRDLRGHQGVRPEPQRGDARRALRRGRHRHRRLPGPVKTEFADVAGIGAAEERVPGFVWTPVEDVARAAVEGAERGRRVVVPGLLNRAGAISGQHAPRALALPLARRIWRRAL